MKDFVRWTFDSLQHLAIALLAALVAFVLLVVLSVVLAVTSAPPAARPRGTTDGATTTVPHPELVPPTAVASPTPAERETSSSAMTALEAADAFLAGDVARFSGVALPGAVQAVSEAKASERAILGGLTLNGEPTILENGRDTDGRRAQTIEIMTDGGPLQLVMVVVAGRWQCEAIRYAGRVSDEAPAS